MAKRKGYDHVKLGITFQELGALLGVRGLLESGTLTHVTPARRSNVPSHEIDTKAHQFNMRFSMLTNGCGTLGCIGGAMALIMGDFAPTYVSNAGAAGHGRLKPLFYPSRSRVGSVESDDWDRVTPQVAIAAIDAFLAGKEPNWKALIDKHGLTGKQVANKKREWNRHCELLAAGCLLPGGTV